METGKNPKIYRKNKKFSNNKVSQSLEPNLTVGLVKDSINRKLREKEKYHLITKCITYSFDYFIWDSYIESLISNLVFLQNT